MDKYCNACGMPLNKKEDFAGGDESSLFCLYCADEQGNVKSADEIFEGGVQYFLSEFGNDRSLAERLVRKNMIQLPYWKGKDIAVLKGDAASDEEFDAAMQKLMD